MSGYMTLGRQEKSAWGLHFFKYLTCTPYILTQISLLSTLKFQCIWKGMIDDLHYIILITHTEYLARQKDAKDIKRHRFFSVLRMFYQLNLWVFDVLGTRLSN